MGYDKTSTLGPYLWMLLFLVSSSHYPYIIGYPSKAIVTFPEKIDFYSREWNHMPIYIDVDN